MDLTSINQQKRIYLDNAATTPVDERVIESMMSCLKNTYGNPSATHSLGRNAKGVLESARKKIASYIGATSKEIIFTSGGTEADNLAIRCAVRDLGVKNIITSPIEHKAVLSTSKELEAEGLVKVHLLDVDEVGRVDYNQLSQLAGKFPGALISLMHANNEIGTLIDPVKVSNIAKKNQCLFHSDTVQTMSHYPINVRDFGADFLTCSAHKFNGPKGVGFLYINADLKIKPLITGGGQERSLRAGTENVAGICGLQTAMEIASNEMVEEETRISNLKQTMKSALLDRIPGIQFNGDTSVNGGLYTVLNCSLPPLENNKLLLFQLDIAGLCVSGGSACNSGAEAGSHVLNALKHPDNRSAIRFSFGRFSTLEDVNGAVDILQKVVSSQQVAVI